MVPIVPPPSLDFVTLLKSCYVPHGCGHKVSTHQIMSRLVLQQERRTILELQIGSAAAAVL